ncbi:NAD(P)H-dependent oxidoreductase [Massilia rubra]|uniref:NAD(P)H-dependent oxidoreductase n=1 Tax=Massilia rubra TaxID=2607910 RepID=A0ABX0LHC4_9BURK|nr:NAD(P)H-dependent oxidoreductase [Massilia rubra]NHZ34094.1 NAD(P)H-dependent oxidoreductase [Massilia rubra]
MKKLIIATHPDIDASTVNKRWLREAQERDSEFTVHQLHQVYGAGDALDVAMEQARLLEHEAVIFQFPLYWFSTPPLLKRWLDEVLLPGFAYGREAKHRKLEGKRIGFAISAGIRQEDYCREGRYHFTVEELLAPLTATFSYIHAKSVPPFVLYGAQYDPTDPDIPAIGPALERSVQGYLAYLRRV